jgi:hypothetical protein
VACAVGCLQGVAQLAQPAWKRNPNERHGAHRTNRRK